MIIKHCTITQPQNMVSIFDCLPIETIENIPGIRCPLSKRIMNDPVVLAATGVSYERDIITVHIDSYGSDPVTGTPLGDSGRRLIQNTMLRRLIDEIVSSIRRRMGDSYDWDHDDNNN